MVAAFAPWVLYWLAVKLLIIHDFLSSSSALRPSGRGPLFGTDSYARQHFAERPQWPKRWHCSRAGEEEPPAMSRVVLVVDDDPDVLQVIAAMLEDIGCDVVTAETGFQALEHINRNHQIEVLITDVNMPGMTGNELAERASRARPDLHVMLLSGRERRRSRFPLIRKPFLQHDLAAAMVHETGRAC